MSQNFEVVISKEMGDRYIDREDCKILLDKHNCDYFISPIHPIEQGSSHEHYHVHIHTHSQNTYDTISKWFSLTSNSIQKIKGQWLMCGHITYLYHYHRDGHVLLDRDQVMTNVSVDFEVLEREYDKKVSNSVYKKQISDFRSTVYDRINSGDLNRYSIVRDDFLRKEVFDTIGLTAYNNYCSLVEQKLISKYMVDGRKVTTIWIYGHGGLGKTELSKYLLRQNDCDDFYISSGGKHPFDDYVGQKGVIFDDINEVSDGKELLKLTDPYNPTFIHCRYHNKFVDYGIMVITSTLSPDEYWKKLTDSERNGISGNVFQLLRRMNGGVFHIEKDSITETQYDGQGHKLESKVHPVPQFLLDVRVKKKDDGKINYGELDFVDVNDTECQEILEMFGGTI